MRVVKDLTGQRFGRLVVLYEVDRISPRHRAWQCRCDCGKTTRVRQDHLGRKIVACGCLQRERTAERSRTHGRSHTPEHDAWLRMRQRCENPTNPDYPEYGGRGIRICARWRTFANFLADMGARPSELHSIDRYPDNDGPYSPDNCRWATAKQQANNRRSRGYNRWHPKPST